MKLKILCTATAGALLAFPALAQTQSGSSIGSGSGMSSSAGASTSSGASSSGLCDTLTGDERAKCLRERAATGTTPSGSAGAGTQVGATQSLRK